jgi:hypothetical protein
MTAPAVESEIGDELPTAVYRFFDDTGRPVGAIIAEALAEYRDRMG